MNAPDDSEFGRFVREYWLLALALHPLLRSLILAEPRTELSGIQLVERSTWLSFSIVEVVVVIAACRHGLRVLPFFRQLARPARVLVGIWLVALVLSTSLAGDVGSAIRSAFGWLLHGTFAMAVWHLVVRDPAQVARGFSRFAAIAPWVTVAIGVLVMWLIYRIGFHSGHPFEKGIPGFSHIRHTGYIFAPAMVLCIGRIAFAARGSWTAMVLLALNAGLCLWFGSRGPFFALLGGLAIACVLFAEFRRGDFMLRNAVAMLAGAILSVLVPSPGHPAFNAIGRLIGRYSGDDFSSGRTEMWLETTSLIADRPLFGYGGGQFQAVSTTAANFFRHPHNFVLQMIFDWGVVGGCAFLGLLVLAGRAVLKARTTGCPASQIGLFGAACMIIFASIDGIMFYSYTIAITMIFVAMALVPAAKRHLRERPFALGLELRPLRAAERAAC